MWEQGRILDGLPTGQVDVELVPAGTAHCGGCGAGWEGTDLEALTAELAPLADNLSWGGRTEPDDLRLAPHET
jgi:hypothetical protein